MAGGKLVMTYAGSKKSKQVKFRKWRKVYGAKSVKKIVNSELNKRVEKKRINTVYNITDFPIGQVMANSSGHYAEDVTPQMIGGTGPNQRIGNDIKIISFHMALQLRQMASATAPVKLTFYLIRAKGFYNGLASQLVTQLFNSNNYIGTGSTIYDAGSDMNVDQIKNFRILKKFNVYMKPDGFTGQQMPILRTVGMKFKTPLDLRWYSGNQADFSSGRIFLLGFVSNGNASTTTASTLANVPVTGTSTGQLINYNIKWYYTDM